MEENEADADNLSDEDDIGDDDDDDEGGSSNPNGAEQESLDEEDINAIEKGKLALF